MKPVDTQILALVQRWAPFPGTFRLQRKQLDEGSHIPVPIMSVAWSRAAVENNAYAEAVTVPSGRHRSSPGPETARCGCRQLPFVSCCPALVDL
jgi:hypothetical protein